jgi:hypothetical protein
MNTTTHDATSIGNILLTIKAISKEELQEALAVQKKERARLGAVLCKLGFCDEDNVSVALTIQGRMRSGDAIGAMFDTMHARMDVFSKKEDMVTRALMKEKEPA